MPVIGTSLLRGAGLSVDEFPGSAWMPAIGFSILSAAPQEDLMVMPVGRTYRAEDEIRASRWAKRMSSSDNGWPARELVLWVQAHTNMARNHVSDEDRDGPISSYGSR